MKKIILLLVSVALFPAVANAQGKNVLSTAQKAKGAVTGARNSSTFLNKTRNTSTAAKQIKVPTGQQSRTLSIKNGQFSSTGPKFTGGVDMLTGKPLAATTTAVATPVAAPVAQAVQARVDAATGNKWALQQLEIMANRDEILKGYHLPRKYIEGYYERRILPYQVNPSYTPSADSSKELYRGMLVTPEELKNLLQKGFSLEKVKWDVGTKEGKKAISFSSSFEEASDYIFQSGSKENGIGVVFTVRRQPTMELGTDPELNATQTIYYSYTDVGPENILGVGIWGEYGPEPLESVLKKAKEGNIQSNANWVNQFNRSFSR